MPETDSAGARQQAERLRDVLARHRLPHGAPGVLPFVTLSIGIATVVPNEDTRSDWLLGQADQALYAAKYSGRNQVVSADKVLAAFAGASVLRRHGAGKRDPASGAQAPGEKIRLALFQSIAPIAVDLVGASPLL
jgi:hypothetical protein